MTWIAPISTAARYENVLSSRLGNTRQPAQGNLRFAGDAFQISQKFKPDVEAARVEEAQRQENEARRREEAEFKAIGDTVVLQRDGETLNVAEMLAYLCKIREDDNYPGYGTVETLAKYLPGMDVEALEQAFQKLCQIDYYYLGFDSDKKAYWLRPNGEKMIEEIFPDIALPPKEKRFISSSRMWAEL